jgi:transcription initiation factor TFIID subunit 1, fungi type
MLKLHGEGDPTGRGEGFSFIRISMKDIFLKAGESAQEKLGMNNSIIFDQMDSLYLLTRYFLNRFAAEIENRPKSGHKYNVVEQWKRYNQEVFLKIYVYKHA